MVERFWRDLATGARAHARTPLATAIIVATLSLGIAATSLSFSIVNSLFIRPLPIEGLERFVRVYRQAGAGTQYFPLHYSRVERIRDLSHVFDAVASEEPLPFIVGIEGSHERVFGEVVSDGYFETLGVRPAQGRYPTQTDERGSEGVLVLSNGLWKRRFTGTSQAIGQIVHVDGRPYRVIGVAPPEFGGTILGFSSDLWIPRSSIVAAGGQPDDSSHFTLARLARGVDVTQARQALADLARRLAAENPASARGVDLVALPETEGRVFPTFRAAVVTASALMVLVAALITTIACTNVGGMLLARGDARRGEIGVRLALGATRGRLVAQLLTESASLAIASGIAGVALAWQGTHLLSATRVTIARGATGGLEVALDERVLAASCGVTVLSAILFGLWPAMETSRPDLLNILRQGDRRTGGAGSWSRRVFLASQVAVSMVLLAVAGLCVRSLQNGREADLGFDATGVVTMAVDVRGQQLREGSRFWSTLLDDVKRLPQTESASLTYRLPLELGVVTTTIAPDGFTPAEGQPWPTTEFSAIAPGYFRTLRIELLEGRDFTERDGRDNTNAVILNELLARRFWPGASGVGRYLVSPDGSRSEVVGVVRRSKYFSIGEDPKPFMYVPIGSDPPQALSIVARGSGDVNAHLRAIAAVVREHAPSAAFYDVGTMSGRVAGALAPSVTAAASLGIVGAMALGLTALGLFGAVAYMAGRRTYEIGVRRALGAPNHSIVWLLTHETLALAAGGLAIGAIMALAASRSLTTLLYDVSPLDPFVFVLAPLVLLAVCLAAVWLPTARALRINAAVALRHE